MSYLINNSLYQNKISSNFLAMVMTIGNIGYPMIFIFLNLFYLYFFPLPRRGGSGEVGQREAALL
jgi:uncharacterized PurR-regulated membrane protein YhhQ (DUF165 family)